MGYAGHGFGYIAFARLLRIAEGEAWEAEGFGAQSSGLSLRSIFLKAMNLVPITSAGVSF